MSSMSIEMYNIEEEATTDILNSFNEEEVISEVEIINMDDVDSYTSFIDIAWSEIEIEQSHVDQESSCSICFESYELGNKVCQTPCEHLYHDDCLKIWLEKKLTCPLCRENFKDESDDESTSVDQDLTDILGANLEIEEFVM